jgi:hypothetical protein
VDEQPRYVEVRVSDEIDIVDVVLLQDCCLLKSDMRREQKESSFAFLGRYLSSAVLELLDDDVDILMGEVWPLLDQIARGTGWSPPNHESVESGERASRRADCRPAHPSVQERHVSFCDAPLVGRHGSILS